MTTWERARTPEQIERRRADILASAAASFAKHGFEATTLTAIAEGASISKASIYRYFGSREEIFLALYEQDLAAWVNDMLRELQPLQGGNNVHAVANVFADAWVRHERFALLSTTLNPIEHHVSVDALRPFKLAYAILSNRVVGALHAAMPALSLTAAGHFVMFAYYFAVGFHPATPPSVAALMQEEPFASGRIEIREALRAHAVVVLLGLLQPTT